MIIPGRYLSVIKKSDLHTPAIAKANGIEMIYQELSLALPISIAENVFVGRLPVTKLGLFDKKKTRRRYGRSSGWVWRPRSVYAD